MARSEIKTAVLPDGLRYKSKVSGSPFVATTSFGSATMSCFMCGKHRPRSMMGTRKVLGKAQAVCAPSCKGLDEMLANPGAAAANAAAAATATAASAASAAAAAPAVTEVVIATPAIKPKTAPKTAKPTDKA